jgi:hypothetical protein
MIGGLNALLYIETYRAKIRTRIIFSCQSNLGRARSNIRDDRVDQVATGEGSHVLLGNRGGATAGRSRMIMVEDRALYRLHEDRRAQKHVVVTVYGRGDRLTDSFDSIG